MKKCDTCTFSRPVVSENGFHSICTLPVVKMLECIHGNNKHYSCVSSYKPLKAVVIDGSAEMSDIQWKELNF
jgi:hypothetical protein